MPEDTRQRVYAWLQLNLDDLLAMQRAALAGETLAERRRPSPLAIGQEELHPWARGVVWDCRPPTRALHEGCCVVADFHAPFESDLNLELFRRRLHGYPDQTLVANLPKCPPRQTLKLTRGSALPPPTRASPLRSRE